MLKMVTDASEAFDMHYSSSFRTNFLRLRHHHHNLYCVSISPLKGRYGTASHGSSASVQKCCLILFISFTRRKSHTAKPSHHGVGRTVAFQQARTTGGSQTILYSLVFYIIFTLCILFFIICFTNAFVRCHSSTHIHTSRCTKLQTLGFLLEAAS